MKKILLVAFHFPPNPGIGSRRWAKFAKHLAQQGHEVFVLAAEVLPEHKNDTRWLADVQHERIHTFRLPTNYPAILRGQVKSFSDKLCYRFALAKVNRNQEGTPYDYSGCWQNALQEKARALIRSENIKHVIVTVAPFRSAFFMAQLKAEFPELKLLVDYRDPWTTGLAYGIPQLSPERKKYELEVEQYVHEKADLITSPHPDVLAELKKQFNGKNYVHLPHAFETPAAIATPTQRDDGKIKLVFGGTIDLLHIEPVIQHLIIAFKKLENEQPTLFQKIDFVFYTPRGKVFQLLSDSGLSCFRFAEPVSPEAFQHVCAQADFLTLLLPDHLRVLMITKTGEYLPFRKPVLAFMEDGFLKTFFESNRIGFSLNRSTGANRLLEILTAYEAQQLDFNHTFDLTAFHYEAVTQVLVQHLHAE